MKTADDFKDGQVILIDKPLHWTSFQVVSKLRWAIKQAYSIKKIKVGHAGTLDPLATGLLVVCTGKMTKQIHTFQDQVKEYTGTIVLGSTTPSYDLETEIETTYPTAHITPVLIKAAVKQFIGTISQVPPVFSAIKKDGKRLYEFARAGQEVTIKARDVKILAFQITEINGLEVQFRVVCSKGTYIRTLANDFGKALNSGAHLAKLRRTGIGEFVVVNALSPEAFVNSLPSF